jgi:hypothetical protein
MVWGYNLSLSPTAILKSGKATLVIGKERSLPQASSGQPHRSGIATSTPKGEVTPPGMVPTAHLSDEGLPKLCQHSDIGQESPARGGEAAACGHHHGAAPNAEERV